SAPADDAILSEMSSAFDILYAQVSVVEQSAFGSEFRADEVTSLVTSAASWVRDNADFFDRINGGYRPTKDEISSLRTGVDGLLKSTTNLLSLTIGKVHNSRTDARET